ncbi:MULTISPECIES: VanZ family protein [unclassified Enterococcus]|uniref:VanZ family protein n=2 Tax=unclassified Enterococcus TaxID=2608891 RepID=UPI001A9A7D13|nr:VanZ family protein [Enterococcus sp. DIV1271a]
MLFLNFLMLLSCLLFSRWFFMRYLYYYSITLFPPSGSVDFWFPFFLVIIIALSLYVSIQCLFTRKIYREWLIFFSFLYLSFLVYLLFLKNIGIRGMELQLFSWVKDLISGDPMIVLFNFLMFLPLGWMLPLSWKSSFLVILSVLGVEWIQYFFYLGIFDLGDVFVNTCGFLLGACIHRFLISRLDIQVSSFLHK